MAKDRLSDMGRPVACFDKDSRTRQLGNREEEEEEEEEEF